MKKNMAGNWVTGKWVDGQVDHGQVDHGQVGRRANGSAGKWITGKWGRASGSAPFFLIYYFILNDEGVKFDASVKKTINYNL
jgi:hypothetical protein